MDSNSDNETTFLYDLEQVPTTLGVVFLVWKIAKNLITKYVFYLKNHTY